MTIRESCKVQDAKVMKMWSGSREQRQRYRERCEMLTLESELRFVLNDCEVKMWIIM